MVLPYYSGMGVSPSPQDAVKPSNPLENWCCESTLATAYLYFCRRNHSNIGEDVTTEPTVFPDLQGVLDSV
jgi:hypothetical protein